MNFYSLSFKVKSLIVCFSTLFVFVISMTHYKDFGVEEITLHNPCYMVAKYNSVSYPIYDSYVPGSWEKMWVHPPIHYAIIGLFMKLFEESLALSVYHAMLASMFFLSILFLPVNSRIFVSLSLGLLASLLFCIYFTQGFSFRPELAMSLFWVAGIAYCENSRLRNFNSSWLSVGSLFIVLGASIHFFAYLSVLSLIFYYALAYMHVRFSLIRFMRIVILPVLLTLSLMFLYFYFYIAPDFSNIISMLFGAQTIQAEKFIFNNPISFFLQHIKIYGFPFGLFAVLIMMPFKQIRYATVSAGLFVFYLTFFQNIKKSYYIIPEMLLFFMAITSIVVFAFSSYSRKLYQWILLLLSGILFVYIIILLSTKPFLSHPINYIREWSIEKLGVGNTIGGRHGLWYISGASKWYNEESCFWKQHPENLSNHLSNADYFAVHPMQQYESSNMRFEGLFACGRINLISVYFLKMPFVVYSDINSANSVNSMFFIDNIFYEGISDSMGEYLLSVYKCFNAYDSVMIGNGVYRFDMVTGLAVDNESPEKISFVISKTGIKNTIPEKNILYQQKIKLQVLNNHNSFFREWSFYNHVSFYKTQEEVFQHE